MPAHTQRGAYHVDWSWADEWLAGPGELVTNKLNDGLSSIGWPTPHPRPEQWAIGVGCSASTLLVYFLLFGARHRRRSRGIEAQLAGAKAKVDELQSQLVNARMAESKEMSERKGKPVRVWMDGAFDMLHYGHMNAFRQGRAHGTYLVVGVNSDDSIAACKGCAPVMCNEERLAAVQGCKFVDEVVPQCPYIMDDDYLDMIFDKYEIDYVVHGDDPCIVDGKNVYQNAIDRGKYRTIPRTEGVSTTDIVGRMLLFSREHHQKRADGTSASADDGQLASALSLSQRPKILTDQRSYYNRPSSFLTTSNFIQLFAQPMRERPAGARVVYIGGAWDMFHGGHMEALQQARSMGDFLIVGIYNDEVVNTHWGDNYPIMNLNERVLSVLGCEHVDDVLIDASRTVSAEMIASLGIKLVVQGATHDEDGAINSTPSRRGPYGVAKKMGILRKLDSTSTLTVAKIVSRILHTETEHRQRFEKKHVVESEYYAERYAHAMGKLASSCDDDK